MKCVFHPDINAEFIAQGNSLCSSCYPLISVKKLMAVDATDLKTLRKVYGLKQKQLGVILGLSESAISYIESGQRTLSIKAMAKLHKFISPVAKPMQPLEE
jgi:DNA-binding XRE family transcriptional regulator